MEVRLFALRDRICAWEFEEHLTGEYSAGAARPFKSKNSLDKISPSEYLLVPFTKKQLSEMEYIDKYASEFELAFDSATTIAPEADYSGLLRTTFGESSRVYQLYMIKSITPRISTNTSVLYLDFEAINMRICGWYGELVGSNGVTVFSGTAKPYSNDATITKHWHNVYSSLLPYTLNQLLSSEYIGSYKRYFVDMFRLARKIYTYGDTDSLFVKNTFGDEVYTFFRVKNIDSSMRIGSRTVSLNKACSLLGVDVPNVSHNPRYDVIKLRSYLEASNRL